MYYYEEIKQELINNEITKKVKDYSKNISDYKVGKLLLEAQGGAEKAEYGNRLIKEYSKKLTNELGKGYSWRNLYNMRQFYIISRDSDILQTVSAKSITWSHLNKLLKMFDTNKVNYYIKIIEQQNLSVRELRQKIKNNEYERLPEETKDKLIKHEDNKVYDFIKNPIIIKNHLNYKEVSEKTLQKLIMEDMPSFLKELGNGFSFIDNEYKIRIGDRYNYIDLLLFNYIYNCFVIVELKVTKLKKEHIGQLQVYMNYIDKNIRNINQDKTIGIIICKKDNKFIMAYCSDSRIFSKEYILN